MENNIFLVESSGGLVRAYKYIHASKRSTSVLFLLNAGSDLSVPDDLEFIKKIYRINSYLNLVKFMLRDFNLDQFEAHNKIIISDENFNFFSFIMNKFFRSKLNITTTLLSGYNSYDYKFKYYLKVKNILNFIFTGGLCKYRIKQNDSIVPYYTITFDAKLNITDPKFNSMALKIYPLQEEYQVLVILPLVDVYLASVKMSVYESWWKQYLSIISNLCLSNPNHFFLLKEHPRQKATNSFDSFKKYTNVKFAPKGTPVEFLLKSDIVIVNLLSSLKTKLSVHSLARLCGVDEALINTNDIEVDEAKLSGLIHETKLLLSEI